jgi:oxysterol-binding protein-related protein 9/10/11
MLKPAGSLTISVTEYCYVTCPSTKMKVILNYLEDGWLSRAQNRVEGAIFSYDPENDNIMKLKEVPENDIIARIEGSWIDKMYYTLGSQPFASATVSLLDSTFPF